MDAAKLTGDVFRVAAEILNENVGPKLMDKVIALRGLALELQAMNADLQCRNVSLNQDADALRRELVEARAQAKRVEDWEALANQFPLQFLDGGIVVRRGRHQKRPKEPVHNLCPTCFAKEQYSPFQRTAFESRGNGSFLDTFACPLCGNRYQMATSHTPL